MKKYRCSNDKCNKVLFEGEFIGTIEKKCSRCKKLNIFTSGNFENIEKFCNAN
jgi:phage FluMu protein Com